MTHLSGGAIFGLVIGGYVLLALVAVRMLPFTWRRDTVRRRLQQRFPFRLRHSSHRGGSLTAPENTLLAFEVAVEQGGTDLLEMDVNISADGVPIVSHDASLERIVAGTTGNDLVTHIVVGSDPNKSLPQLMRRIRLHFPSQKKGQWFDAATTAAVPLEGQPPNKTRLCLLKEVFEAFPSTPIHLDIKTPSDDLTRKVVELIEAFQREHITIVGCARGNEEALRRELSLPSNRAPEQHADSSRGEHSSLVCRSQTSQRRKYFRTFASAKQVAVVHLLYFTGLLPFVPLDFDVFSIPLPTEIRRLMMRGMVGSWMSWVLCFFLRSPTLWWHLQRRGIAVIGWVLNDEEEFHEASQWPVNGLMTDDPIALRQFFERNGDGEMLTWDAPS